MALSSLPSCLFRWDVLWGRMRRWGHSWDRKAFAPVPVAIAASPIRQHYYASLAKARKMRDGTMARTEPAGFLQVSARKCPCDSYPTGLPLPARRAGLLPTNFVNSGGGNPPRHPTRAAVGSEYTSPIGTVKKAALQHLAINNLRRGGAERPPGNRDPTSL